MAAVPLALLSHCVLFSAPLYFCVSIFALTANKLVRQRAVPVFHMSVLEIRYKVNSSSAG